MKTKKMSLADVQGKLSRAEMKNIIAGSGGCTIPCSCNGVPQGNVCSVQECWDLCP